MKTKILIPLLTLACLLATSATAQVNYAVSGSTAYVTNSPNASGNIVIASTYNGYPVTAIGDSAFQGCTSLTNVTIPNSVTSIGDVAFAACRSMTNVAIPGSVTSIGARAFSFCGSLTNFSVDAANSVYSSLDGVLFNKAQTALIQFPSGRVGSYAIPNSVTNIGDYVFYYCTGLTNVTIPNGVISIGYDAFYFCTHLTSVTIPDSVKSIANYSFSDCLSLTSVSIPNSVLSIGNQAFAGCRSLSSVSIPDSVISIGVFAFASCTSLTNFSVDAANSVYSSLDGVLFNKAQTALIQFPGGRGGSYAIPNNVTNIGGAFSFCSSLTNVTIGNSVTGIGDYAFEFCTSLTNLRFLGNAPSEGVNMFDNIAAGAKVFYYYGTTGWGKTFGGVPTVMLGAPAPQVGAGSAGVKADGFGFTLSGVVNQTIVIEASTNLANWQPIWTNTLATLSTNLLIRIG